MGTMGSNKGNMHDSLIEPIENKNGTKSSREKDEKEILSTDGIN